MMSATVLIIDDEEKLRQLLARILQLEGYTILQAGALRQGLLQLQQHEVDVVICDVKLPDANGVEAVRQLRDKAPQTEIILLTAYGNISDGYRPLRTGPLIILPKETITTKSSHWSPGLWKGFSCKGGFANWKPG